ncbi:MAG: class I SAM-dependent methyltransferase [Pseudobdellovibrionaceae bacterium]
MENKPLPQKRTLWTRIWLRMCRFRIYQPKVSTSKIDALCEEFKTDKMTLVVHSEDVKYKPYFPNAYAVTKRKDKEADMHVDLYYTDLKKIPDESYEVILCTGLLEHIPDPQRIIADFHRILKPGGKLIIGASAVFSFHECPDDFFHFTPFSFKLLFKDWSHFEMLRGSCMPFKTISILLQRILIQCDTNPFIRPFIEALVFILPLCDKLIYRQYDNYGDRSDEHLIDSMLPSNMHACVVK